MRVELSDLINMQREWIALSKNNPHVANVFNKCIGDLELIIKRAMVAENDKLEFDKVSEI